MSLFTYKAVSPDGRTVLGRIDALNMIDLEMRLRRMELDLVNGEPISNRSLFGGSGVPRRELIHFCFHLEQLARAGVPILEGLVRPARQPRASALSRSRRRPDRIDRGRPDAVAGDGRPGPGLQPGVRQPDPCRRNHRPPADVLQSLTESLKWEDELASQTKKLIMYPAFVGTIVIAATFFLMIYMVPQLKQFVKNMGQVLPLQTKVLFFVSDLLVSYWYVLLLLPILLAFGLQIAAARQPAGAPALRRAPSCDCRSSATSCARSSCRALPTPSRCSTRRASRFSIRSARRRTSSATWSSRQGLERVEQLIGEGQNVTAAFHSIGFFPPLVIRMLRVGESTGALDDALINVSYFYNRDVKESVERVQQLIEPMLTVVLGACSAGSCCRCSGRCTTSSARSRPSCRAKMP